MLISRSRLVSLASVAALLVAVTVPSATPAMTLRQVSVETVAERATLIVHGHVVANRSEAVPGSTRKSRTRHTLYVWDVLKAVGEADPVLASRAAGEDLMLDLVLPGGTRGTWTTVVPGVPTLQPGDEVIVCLRQTAWGWQPVGYGLGMWRVGLDGGFEHLFEGAAEGDSFSQGGPADLAPLLDHLGEVGR